MESKLSEKTCVACKKGTPPLKEEEANRLLAQIGEWKIIDNHHLEREYRFSNFAKALSFTNCVGAIAEEEGHHPDIYLSWGKVKLIIFTHAIDGLTESDFILAAKCEDLFGLSE